jgi:hypothetical protein
MPQHELVEIMRDGSGRRVHFGELLTRAGVVHDVTGGHADRYAVLGSGRLGVGLVEFGDRDPKYFTNSQVVFDDREAAEARAAEIASIPLVDAVRGQAPYGFPFDRADYHNLGRYWFSGCTEPKPWVYSSAVVAAVNPQWAPPEVGFTFPLREGLTVASYMAIGELAGVELALATVEQGGEQ